MARSPRDLRLSMAALIDVALAGWQQMFGRGGVPPLAALRFLRGARAFMTRRKIF
jgi:hypothetical protein